MFSPCPRGPPGLAAGTPRSACPPTAPLAAQAVGRGGADPTPATHQRVPDATHSPWRLPQPVFAPSGQLSGLGPHSTPWTGGAGARSVGAATGLGPGAGGELRYVYRLALEHDMQGERAGGAPRAPLGGAHEKWR